MTDAFDIARAVIGVTLVVIVPGYSLVTALFPAPGSVGAERGRPLDPLTKLMLVPASSIAQTVLVVLVTFLLPWGIRATTLLLALVLLSACLLAVASKRGHLVGRLVANRPIRLDARGLIGILVGGFALIVAGAVSVTSATSAREVGGPQLWLLPDSPTPRSLEVGVVNGSSGGVFRLSVEAPNGAGTLVFDSTIPLTANETWTRTIPMSEFDVPAERVEAVLTPVDPAVGDPLRVQWVQGEG